MSPELQKALRLLSCGALEDSEALLRRLLEDNPADRAALSCLAQFLDLSGSLEEAALLYRRLLELEPGSSWHWTALAESLHASSRPQEAESAYWRAIDLEEENESAWRGLAELLQEQGREKEAAAALAHAAELEADVPLEVEPDPVQEEERRLLHAVQRDPESLPAWLELARFLAVEASLGDPGCRADALAAFRRVLQLDSSHHEARLLAMELLDPGEDS